MEIKIIEVEGLDLFRWYPGQSQPQDCYIEFDPSEGTLRASYNPEIGNAVPVAVWHKRILCWEIKALKADCANDLMRDLVPLCERIAAGYSERWDGSNLVGELDDDATDAAQDAEEKCCHADGELEVWDAFDYLAQTDADDIGLTADSTDEDLERIEDELQQEAEANGIDYVWRLDKALRQMRDELRERSAEA
jgi:hypothetical protein